MSKEFKPEYMQMAVLTAALQELTPRDKRRQDPDLAVEDWIRFGRDLGVHRLQLSSALPEELADVPPEAMLDPVADHLNVLKPLDPSRVRRIQSALKASEMSFSDLGYFDNMLVGDRALAPDQARLDGEDHGRRRRPRGEGRVRVRGPEHLARHGPEPRGLRAELRAPPEGGQGPRPRVPRRAVPDAGLEHRPTNWHNQIGYTPGDVDPRCTASREAQGRRPAAHPLRPVPRDPDGPEHARRLPVPEGRGLRVPDRRLPREGPGHQPQGRGGVGLRRADGGRAATARTASPIPTCASRSAAWLKQVVLWPRTSCRARRGTIPSPTCRTGRWTGSTTSSRRASCCSSRTASRTVDLVVEHEYPDARVQDPRKLAPILKGSIAFTRAIDEAAAAMFALHRVLESQGIKVQGVGREGPTGAENTNARGRKASGVRLRLARLKRW